MAFWEPVAAPIIAEALLADMSADAVRTQQLLLEMQLPVDPADQTSIGKSGAGSALVQHLRHERRT